MDWDDFPIVPASDEASGRGQTVELTENGYGALVAWEAGPQHVRRCVQPAGPPRMVRVTVEKPGQPPVSWDEEMTAEERQSIVDDINDFLADAGIPAQPAGYQWLLDLPSGSADDFWTQLGRHVHEVSVGPHPVQTRRAVAVALRRLGVQSGP